MWSQNEIIKTAEECGFTRTHEGEVQLWLANKNDLANFFHVVAEDAYHRAIQNGVVAGADNEREACAKICDKEVEEWGYDADVVDCAIAIRARGNK